MPGQDTHHHKRTNISSTWLERVFQRRECIKFIPADDHSDRCCCGRVSAEHSQLALSRFTSSVVTRGARFHLSSTGQSSGHWTIGTCTACTPTDAYGTVEFQGGTHVHKARYLRLSFDSDPADIMNLMESVPEKLGRVFREGLLKAAETTGAWVLTSGLDSGIVKHVAKALDEAGISARMRSRIVTVGIAPWGMLQRREQLIGHDTHVVYDRQNISSSPIISPSNERGEQTTTTTYGGVPLNDRGSYFLLADNGTSNRYGAEIVLRRRLEEFLAKKCNGVGENRRRIPTICVALEGGICTLNAIYGCLRGQPPIPVWVIACEGSGRVCDLLAMGVRHFDENGKLTPKMRSRMLSMAGKLSVNNKNPCNSPEALLYRISQCVEKRNNLLTVFRVPENHLQYFQPDEQKMDRVILRALLHGQDLTPVDQLLLTLAWGREDIAKSEIFNKSSFPSDPDWLIQPMMEALLSSKVEFVRLFLEQGLSPRRFLTFQRLEYLYNAGPSLLPLMSSSNQQPKGGAIQGGKSAFSLPEIGAAIERLMGNAFRSTYTTRAFKLRYECAKSLAGQKTFIKRSHSRQLSSLQMCLSGSSDYEESGLKQPKRKVALTAPGWEEEGEAATTSNAQMAKQKQPEFSFPFNELMLWAVLTKRHEMAKLFWQHGEEPLAKALAAIRLYKFMSREVAHDYAEMEVSNQLRECAQEFRDYSLELLNHCHEQDQRMTMRLLSAELPNWGQQTCLSLAVIANNKRFLAHPCCQILLAELWHGGVRLRSQSNIKVILGLLFPPTILLLDFKIPLYTSNTERNNHSTAIGALESERPLLGDDCFNDDNLREMVDDASFKKHQNPLCLCISKFGMFYSAPITSFWVWAISFLLFMFLLIYVLLIEFPLQVTYIEWLIFAYVLALGMEHFRKLLILEASSILEKIRIFYSKYWNMLTTVAILSYFGGFAFRFDPVRVHSHSRVILAVNSVLWHMKTFDFMSVHPRIGPYITMAGKMVLAMSYIIALLMVTLMAFGVARQSITFPHEKWAWILVRNIFYKPYFMLYGEVYAGEIDTCGDEGTNCVPGHWIPPILMTVFLLIANILLINMLIAIFNNIFNVTNAMSRQVWMFQRYGQVLEYKSTPVLPPPFTPIAHMMMLFRRICKSRMLCPFHYDEQQQKANTNDLNSDFALKIQLRTDELRDLQDFEEDCMDDLSRRKFRQKDNCAERRRNSDRHCFSDFSSNRELLVQLQKMQAKIDKLEQIQEKMFGKFVERQNKQCQHQKSGDKELNLKQKEERITNKKAIPKARVFPINLNNEEENILEQQNNLNLPQILLPQYEEEEEREESLDSSEHSNQFCENEEDLAGIGQERENGNERQQQTQQRHLNIVDNRQRNYSVSLNEDLEQMFGMLKI
uniref:LSDAT_euk domain-containing protein n=1 Tax=Meloidogyne hapla TaxID=6305 RepID=A0A1I8BFI2_MELHA